MTNRRREDLFNFKKIIYVFFFLFFFFYFFFSSAGLPLVLFLFLFFFLFFLFLYIYIFLISYVTQLNQIMLAQLRKSSPGQLAKHHADGKTGPAITGDVHIHPTAIVHPTAKV